MAVLIVEIIGVSSMLRYGLMLVCCTVPTGSRWVETWLEKGAVQCSWAHVTAVSASSSPAVLF